MRLTHAEIYLNNLKSNIKNIRSLLKPKTKICAAVKANAYGNGAVQCAKAAVEAGASFLAVATVSEGIELRNAGIETPVLLLSLCSPPEIEDVVKYSITPLVFDKEFINLLDSEISQKQLTSKKFPVHLAVDSGMGRIGALPEDALSVARQIVQSDNLELGGMCTQFAVADSDLPEDIEYTEKQFSSFMSAVNSVQNAGINPGIRHCCNSPATLNHPEWQLDMVRPGIIVYGYYPGKITKEYLLKKGLDFELKPVMTLVSGVSAIRHFEKGKSVSYGCTWTASKETDIAVIPVGYGDGFLRRFSKVVKPAIAGKEYSICGRICMDQCMIDLGNESGVKRWDKVVLFGSKEAGAFISAQEIADATDTIPYEIMTGITARVERIYIE